MALVSNNLENDTDLSENDWKNVIEIFKNEIKTSLGSEFPDNAEDQLWGGIEAVFKSWNGSRAISYRKIENIPEKYKEINKKAYEGGYNAIKKY